MIVFLLAGCGWFPADGDPVIEAHRGGAGYWPENSRTALQGAVDMDWEAVEFDLFLTSDRVPVLAHDAYLNEETCTTAEGQALGDRVWLFTHTLAELQAGYLCGGEPDPEMPDAEVVADTLLTFDEAIDILADAPDMAVHLDVKWWVNVSHDPNVIAAEVLERWWAADLPNLWYASADTEEMIAALEDRGEVTTSLSWPRFPPESSSTAVGIGHDLAMTAGLSEGIAAARDAGSDGLALPWQLAERDRVEIARDEGLAVQIWTINDDALLEQLQGWPVDALITDYPEPAP